MSIHLVRAGWTLCGIHVPDMWRDDSWLSADKPEAETEATCEYCLSHRLAPICSRDPASLDLYTVYKHPRDFPDEYVIRESHVLPTVRGEARVANGEIVCRGESLEEVHRQLFALPRGPGLTRLPRQDADDPVIVEVWI